MTSDQHCFSVPLRSLWKCQTSSFHLSEILSDLLCPSSSAEASVCTGPCFIWISKPVRRSPDILNSIFWASLKECDCLSVLDEGDLIPETMLPLWQWGDSNLYLLSALETRWTQKCICISLCSSFRLHSLDGIWEIVHIFWPWNQTTWNMLLMRLRPTYYLLSCIHN